MSLNLEDLPKSNDLRLIVEFQCIYPVDSNYYDDELGKKSCCLFPDSSLLMSTNVETTQQLFLIHPNSNKNSI